jgi:hypothetical protein
MTCETLRDAYLSALTAGFHCTVDDTGRLCIVTPYLYPDHDFIEVFVKDKGSQVVVSDLGETLRHLDTTGMDVRGTPGLRFAAERIAGGLGVKLEGGVLVKRGSIEDVGRITFDLLSAVKLVSSLVFGNRAYEPLGFDDQVADFFEVHGIEAKRKSTVVGNSGTTYSVSFRVQSGKGESLLQTVSPKSQGGIRGAVNATYRMWADANKDYPNRKYSLLNDDGLTFRKEDLTLLKSVSHVHYWTERAALVAAVKGN